MPPEKTIFVACPIGDAGSPQHQHSDDLLSFVIEPVVVGLRTVGIFAKLIRGDTIEKPGSIVAQVIRQLAVADVVVADLTGLNPNVMFEVGIRHANGKPLIFMAQKEHRLPFDLYDHRTIFYALEVGQREVAANLLREQLIRAFSVPENAQNELPQNQLLDVTQSELTWDQVERGVENLSLQMEAASYRPDTIICIGRSGSIVGAWLSGYYEAGVIPITTINFQYNLPVSGAREQSNGSRRTERIIEHLAMKGPIKNALLLGVDVISGGTIDSALRELKELNVEITSTACLVWNPHALYTPTYFSYRLVTRPRYPWMKSDRWRGWNFPPTI